MEGKAWYLCDPEKNAECEKTFCIYNPKARFRACMHTKKMEFARLDLAGNPCEDAELEEFSRRIREELA